MKQKLALRERLSRIVNTLSNDLEFNNSTLEVNESYSICTRLLEGLKPTSELSHSNIAKQAITSLSKYNVECVQKEISELNSILEEFSLASLIESTNTYLKSQRMPIFSNAIIALDLLENSTNDVIKESRHIFDEHIWIQQVRRLRDVIFEEVKKDNTVTTLAEKRSLISPVFNTDRNSVIIYSGNILLEMNLNRDLNSIKQVDPKEVNSLFLECVKLIRLFNLNEDGTYEKHFKGYKVHGNFETNEHFINNKSIDIKDVNKYALNFSSTYEDLQLLNTLQNGKTLYENIFVIENAFEVVFENIIYTNFYKGNNITQFKYNIKDNQTFCYNLDAVSLTESLMKTYNLDVTDIFENINVSKDKKFKILDEIKENDKKISFVQIKIDEVYGVKNQNPTTELNEIHVNLINMKNELKYTNSILEKSIEDDGFVEAVILADIPEYGIDKGTKVLVDALSFSKSGKTEPIECLLGGNDVQILKKHLKITL